MKLVLLPTDFSQNALNAINYAIEMFREEQVTFKLFHAYKVFDYHEQSKLSAVPGKQILERTYGQVETELGRLMELVSDKAGKEHVFKTCAHNLLLVDAIKTELSAQIHHLIVIGTQGTSEGVEGVYGSNTISIMEEVSRCPILAVPAHATYKPLKEIVLANSFKLALNSHDLKFLTGLAKKFNASIRVLHIAEAGGLNRPRILNRKRLQKKLAGVKHSFHVLEYLSVPMGIYSFSESRGSDMIAFINKKHTFFQNLLFQPLYKNLAFFTKVPVLVLHQPQQNGNPAP